MNKGLGTLSSIHPDISFNPKAIKVVVEGPPPAALLCVIHWYAEDDRDSSDYPVFLAIPSPISEQSFGRKHWLHPLLHLEYAVRCPQGP